MGHHGIISVTCPGNTTLMTPPQVHMQVQVLSSAGMLPRITLGTPGIHGAGVTGTQGTGVSTPAAAVVAVATAGFEGVMHMPNGLMLTIGT